MVFNCREMPSSKKLKWNVLHIFLVSDSRASQPMDYLGTVYYTAKNSVIKAERRILKVRRISVL